MLMIIEKQDKQTVSEKEMLLLYDKDLIITKRLDDLRYGGYLKKIDEEYQITPKGAFISKIYKIATSLLNLPLQEK